MGEKRNREKLEEARRQKRREKLMKHVVTCPHCGEDALDHMTECPHCKGKLTPLGYKPMSEKKQKLFRRIGIIVGIAVAVAVVIVVFATKNA